MKKLFIKLDELKIFYKVQNLNLKSSLKISTEQKADNFEANTNSKASKLTNFLYL